MMDDPRGTCRQPPRRPAARCRHQHGARDHRRVPDHAGPGYVDLTIVEFAAHTAYLEPLTGTGFLLLPAPDTDVPAPDDSSTEVTRPDQNSDRQRRGLSLLNADWEFALDELDQLGWMLLDDEDGRVEAAGRTTDGRVAICLYGGTAIIDEPSQTDFLRALTALRFAVKLLPDEP